MFGKILKLEGNILYIENTLHKTETKLMNTHIIFPEDNNKFVGEIIFMDESLIKVSLVGNIINDEFYPGINKKPTGKIQARVISEDELEILLGQKENKKNRLLIGKSSIYEDFDVSISLNSFFANHSAIIGNTGAGKSCGVARILQNLFISNKYQPINAHFVLFDAYGEYVNTFNNMPGELNFKSYGTSLEESNYILKYPVYFLDTDDLAILLSIDTPDQIPVLEKTLKLVKIFKSNSPQAIDYKNDIIAKCLLDIFSSGNTPSQCRDQVIAVLTNYHTATLNLNSLIKQPGYNRTLRQCLLIDEQGKINAIHEIIEFLQSFNKVDIETFIIPEDLNYTLEDLYYALEFALISEGTFNSDLSYEKNNILKSRLINIINSEYSVIFKNDYYLTKEQFVKEFFLTSLGEKVQLININLSNVDDRFAKILTKLYSKLFFNFTTKLKPRGTYSINVFLEEAHRYVQNDNDLNIIGYNIFDRITKEGRKYGMLLTFITQRPSELSQTALSQCSNFLVFRVFHPKDLEIVRNISTNVTNETIEKLKTLNPGTMMIFGVGLRLPILVNLELPIPMPESTSLNVSKMWFDEEVNIIK